MTQSFSPNDPTLNRSNEVLWQVEENYTAFDWFKKVIKNTFNYQGRARRKEYWYYILIASIIISNNPDGISCPIPSMSKNSDPPIEIAVSLPHSGRKIGSSDP